VTLLILALVAVLTAAWIYALVLMVRWLIGAIF
jgi:hypothetical protein